MHVLLLLLLLGFTPAVLASPNNVGQSGAPGCQTCAASCHGPNNGTVEVTGFPDIYTPNETYLITVRKLSGFSIKNFNASVRIGYSTRIAGSLDPGLYTAVYHTPVESTGVHLATLDHDSATFYWTAPLPIGPVRLYLAAHQGPRNEGPNSTLVLWSNMAYPDTARNPRPPDGSMNTLVDVVLFWTPGNGTISHDVYFGTEADPPFIANQTDSLYDPPGSLEPITQYYWRINERNNAGVTIGPVWSFFTHFTAADDLLAELPQDVTLGPAYPNPFNASVTVPFSLPKAGAVSLELFDMTGRHIAKLTEGVYSAGVHRVQWNAESIPSGIYLLRLTTAEHATAIKVVAMK